MTDLERRVARLERLLASETPGWLNVAAIRRRCGFSSDKAARSWLQRQGIYSVRRGRFILVSEADLEKALRQPAQKLKAVS